MEQHEAFLWNAKTILIIVCYPRDVPNGAYAYRLQSKRSILKRFDWVRLPVNDHHLPAKIYPVPAKQNTLPV